MRGSCLTENTLYYTKKVVMTKNINRNCIKESGKQPLRNVTQIIKKVLVFNKNITQLHTEYWKLANKKLHPRISWCLKGKHESYNPNSRRCSLCLLKKLEIVDDPDEILLNKCSEVLSQCHHGNKYELKTLVNNKKDRGST